MPYMLVGVARGIFCISHAPQKYITGYLWISFAISSLSFFGYGAQKASHNDVMSNNHACI